MAELIALAGTPGAFPPGTVLHIWTRAREPLCGSAAFRAAWPVEWPGVLDSRPICARCRSELDRVISLVTTHDHHKETTP